MNKEDFVRVMNETWAAAEAIIIEKHEEADFEIINIQWKPELPSEFLVCCEVEDDDENSSCFYRIPLEDLKMFSEAKGQENINTGCGDCEHHKISFPKNNNAFPNRCFHPDRLYDELDPIAGPIGGDCYMFNESCLCPLFVKWEKK